ncbi:MAG: hypothetical protein CM15mP71_6750 [Candidatus Poseidoniales archaeon]|nr:MAG: hypothetical protein CM15mP71_6750 [Candidatus Poseidoniales archaeon]
MKFKMRNPQAVVKRFPPAPGREEGIREDLARFAAKQRRRESCKQHPVQKKGKTGWYVDNGELTSWLLVNWRMEKGYPDILQRSFFSGSKLFFP